MASVLAATPASAQVSSEEKPEAVAKTSPSPSRIAESEAKSVAQEKEANTKENANPGKEKEGKGIVRQKEIESITGSVTEEVADADASFTVGATNNTVADTTGHVNAGSNRSAGNLTRLRSASRGREVWISRRSGLRTAAKPDAASWLVVLVAAGSYLPVPFAVCAK